MMMEFKCVKRIITNPAVLLDSACHLGLLRVLFKDPKRQ